MRTMLNRVAAQGGSFPVTVDFVDGNAAPFVPDAIVWTLYDGAGNVVNGRSAVVVDTPASSVTIVLTGADLAITGHGKRELKTLVVTATWDGLGPSNLPIKQFVDFYVERRGVD